MAFPKEIKEKTKAENKHVHSGNHLVTFKC